MTTPLIDDLIALAPPKTWSLVVTIFGDMSGDAISGKDLRILLGQMGVRPEALRVAMHRLKKDGWITTTKSGREVTYHLSDFGRTETQKARQDIYRQDVKFAEGWQVVMIRDEPVLSDIAVNVSRSIALLPKSKPIPTDALVLDIKSGTLPQWTQDNLVAPHLVELAAGLLRLSLRFDGLATEERVTARLLMLHHWRKLALKHGVWALIGLMPDGPLAQCHQSVTRIINKN